MTRKRAASSRDGVRFDEARADRVCDVFEKVLRHTKGKFARQPFLLEPWQRDGIVRPLFGTVRFDDQHQLWVRRYTLAWIELARKNGKSELLAGIALILLCADDEEGAEVYSAAMDKEQAGIVYGVAKRMVELSPLLSKRLKVIDSDKRIIDPKTSSFYKVIPSDKGGSLGQNPHGIIFDEVLTQPSRDLWDELKTGMGARTQPLMVAATTAGDNVQSFCYEEHEYSMKVARTPSDDPSRFVFMRNTPMEADWRDEEAWRHANPALGSFLSIETMRNEAREAEGSPARQVTFRTFRLNQWLRRASTEWLDLDVWDASAGMVVADQLAGRRCFGGLDLASTSDFAAWVLVFPDDDGESYDLLARFWLPSSALDRRDHMRDVLRRWEGDGWLTVTEGDSIDYGVIERDIGIDAARFDVEEFAFDRWNATQLVQTLGDGGLFGFALPQTAKALNAPTKELERLVRRKQMRHGGNPVLRWMVSNTHMDIDAEENVKPSKKRSADKIDGVAATINALASATRPKEGGGRSVYEKRGAAVV